MEDQKKQINKFGQSFTITPYLVSRILKVIKGNCWKFIIAPYEADPQLAYLYKSGKVDVVFTEDSDLIAYGVNRILYKMDNKGDGLELDMSKLYYPLYEKPNDISINKLLTETSLNKIASILTIKDSIWIDLDQEMVNNDCEINNDSINKSNKITENLMPLFQKDKFLTICILAGWDYLEPIKGIGFKTAHKLIEEHETIENVLKSINSSTKYTIPKDYLSGFKKAYLTFLFQVIYDPLSCKLAYLSEPDEDTYYGKMLLEMEDKTFLGDLNRTDDTQTIPEESNENESTPKSVIDVSNQEVEIINERINLIESSENEDNSGSSSIKEASDYENKPLLKKKSESCQKKMWFAMKSKNPEKKKVPSPYKK